MTRRPRGYVLIELMVVITVVAVMLTLAAGMIHLLLKADRSGRTASDEAGDLARLARDFRGDAHASGSVEQVAERTTFRLDAGQTVEYQARPSDILRTVRDGEKIRHFESYRRPPRTAVLLTIQEDGPRPFASLVLDRPADGQGGSLYGDYRIEAELGKDRRLNPRPE